MKKIGKLLYWIFAIFLIYLIVELLRKIFGGGLGFEELVIALLVGDLVFSFQISLQISEISSKLSEHLGWCKGKFEKLS